MFNLGMILQGEISSLSLFGVWGLEKVNVQIIENLVCLAFLFTLQQDVSKIGIFINLKNILYYCNFLSQSLKISSCLMMYFCCRQRKLNCKDLKRENNCTCCSKVQKQKMSQGTHSLFVWAKNVGRIRLRLWKLKKNELEVPVLILNAAIFIVFLFFFVFSGNWKS